jgi:hypothetical protein
VILIDYIICVVGNITSIDQHRIHLCISLLSFRSTELTSLAIIIQEYGVLVLEYITMHTLSVVSLSQDITNAIQAVTQLLYHRILNHTDELTISEKSKNTVEEWELDFHFVSPMNVFVPLLHIHFTDYFQWLRKHMTDLAKDCRVCEVIETTVHPSLRSSLRDECYTSIYDLLHRYHDKYKRLLTNMMLPLYSFDRDDIEQVGKYYIIYISLHTVHTIVLLYIYIYYTEIFY